MNFDYQLLKIPDWTKYYSRSLILMIGFILIAFIGIGDYITGYEMAFSIFYMLPITLVTLTTGFKLGILTSFLSAGIWLLTDLLSGHKYSHILIPFWNAATRLGYFSLHTVLLTVLLRLLEQAKEQSLKDGLTGIANWKFFAEITSRELSKARRANEPITIAYVDLDNFKNVNDTFGHDVGDNLLRTTANMLQAGIRSGDIVARVGGDEFSLLFPNTNYRDAEILLKRLVASVNNEMKSHIWPVTISIGAVTFRLLPASVETMIKKADELMYKVKKSGKNNIIHQEWPSPEPNCKENDKVEMK